jgi:predicted metal-dependent HD superfamily phosphohydrolase
MLPKSRFEEMWRALGARSVAHEIVERLRTAYDEPHRAYHNATHISACLRLLDDPAVRALATHPAEVEAALWFHDAIYDTHASDNEERSAVLAEECLRRGGVAGDVASRIAEHVRATKSHIASSADGVLVIDIDLSILGESRTTFELFEEQIRREYSWVPPEQYAAGRIAVLRRFSERPEIYATPLFRARFEAPARANLIWAIERFAARSAS